MGKYNFDKKSLIDLIKKSYTNKKSRDYLIDNYEMLNDSIIDIHVIKLIDNHPIKKFKTTMLCLLGHKNLQINVLLYIASLGYYPEAFYKVLISKSNQCISHDEFISFLDYNLKYVMELDEFLESIDYMNDIPIEKKKEIFNYLNDKKIIN